MYKNWNGRKVKYFSDLIVKTFGKWCGRPGNMFDPGKNQMKPLFCLILK